MRSLSIFQLEVFQLPTNVREKKTNLTKLYVSVTREQK